MKLLKDLIQIDENQVIDFVSSPAFVGANTENEPEYDNTQKKKNKRKHSKAKKKLQLRQSLPYNKAWDDYDR